MILTYYTNILYKKGKIYYLYNISKLNPRVVAGGALAPAPASLMMLE